MKERAIEWKDFTTLLCCDDKAKVPIGDPGVNVSTGVRGKKSIAPIGTTLGALDHDMTKASLTPSVYFKVDVPDSIDQSFYRGKIYITLNDSVFETSSPVRHSAATIDLLNGDGVPKVLLKYTDGGTDQRNTLESVKLANIIAFKQLDLDMLIHVRCAPGQSWVNPAERCMSVLNIALQNCSLSRDSCTKEVEHKLKSANSMAAIRAAAEKMDCIKTEWSLAVAGVKAKVADRFSRVDFHDD